MGVPNTALNRPEVPHMAVSFASPLSRRKIPVTQDAAAAPIWRAAPSLPADPPHSCVSEVPMKMRGAIRGGTSSPVRSDEITRLAPLSWRMPAAR